MLNLTDLLRRKDSRVEFSADIAFSVSGWMGQAWSSLVCETAGRRHILVKNFQHSHAYRSRPSATGWYARALGAEAAHIRIALQTKDTLIYDRKIQLGSEPAPVRIDWPVLVPQNESVTLSVTLVGCLELLVHRRMKRTHLYELAHGDGIEIGPGPRPQILPSEQTRVQYLEAASQEEWSQNDQSGKYGVRAADWSQYIIGMASELPVPDRSLDFIFSSHVFEHLANPLGHLQRWREKLRPGGRVLAVVPDFMGCKDYYATPSTLQELEDELRRDIWTPEVFHYQRFGTARQIGGSPQALMEKQASIHVHFYGASNMPGVLDYAVSNLGYTSYALKHEPNHKDFYFVLHA